MAAEGAPIAVRAEHPRPAARRVARRVLPCTALVALALATRHWAAAPSREALASVQAQDAVSPADAAAAVPAASPVQSLARRLLRTGLRNPLADLWRTCAVAGGTCRCTGTLIFSTLLGDAVREINADGEVQCTAEALGAPAHLDPRLCWCLDGVPWGDEVRKGLAAMVRQGLTPRVEIATDETKEPGCDSASDGLWYGCIMMSRRWDTSVVPQVMTRTAPAEEQLDMALRKLDACQRMAPQASLRVLGVRSGQAADAVEMRVKAASICSVVYRPEVGAVWTAKKVAAHCASEPGHCTTTPCECRRGGDLKLELKTPEGRQCWACAEPGKEYKFRVNALAEQMSGASLSWWPPYGINCPPILWFFMDWRAVARDCPTIATYMCVLFGCLLLRKVEELTGGLPPWTRVAPLFGPTLKRGEAWRFFSFTFVHLQFLDLFHNLLTLLDTLDVEGTPAIVLGDGSNLKCGVGAKQNFMCYPSIGLGSYHTLMVALVSAAVGGMAQTWISFRQVYAGASALGFGLSGAIVALYALYAGAELDQSTSTRRSFQDWVWLRLIFVGFHIAMEFIRGVSQRDAAGLFAHTAAFGAGFGYVMAMLPPMGDGTLLPSDRPYVVPCAYDAGEGLFADAAVPLCVRLFSQAHEYQVPVVQKNALLLFGMVAAYTVVNIFVFNKQTSANEAALLAGMEVSAVCCQGKPQGGAQQPTRSNYDGTPIVFWCHVLNLSRLQPPNGGGGGEGGGWRPVVEVRCLGSDPKKDGGSLLGATPEASARTRRLEGGHKVEVGESLFLPVRFSKTTFVQLVLYDSTTGEPGTPLGFASLPLYQALRFNRQAFSRQRLRLQAVGSTSRFGFGSGRGIAEVVFSSMTEEELQIRRQRFEQDLDTRKFELMRIQQSMKVLRQAIEVSSAPAPDGGLGPL